MPSHMTKNSYLLAALCAIMLLTACRHFYKTTSIHRGASPGSASTVDSLRLTERYFILRNGGESFYMKDPILGAGQKTLECTLDSIAPDHLLHITKGKKGYRRYSKDNPYQVSVLNEVHFYISPDTTATVGKYMLDLNKVQKIEVIEKDKGRTATSYVIGAVGFTVGALAVVAIIVAATKSSCPFVSAYNGNEFSLQGEIYGGAIYPQLARHDFIPLKMSPLSDGTLQLKISNELKEHQYTDMAELMVITHDIKTNVWADEKGDFYGVADPHTPLSAQLNNHKDVQSALTGEGDYEMLYMDDTSNADARNEVVMKFKKPLDVAKGKLILSLKNSYWLDMLYGELAKGFGTHYAKYIQDQHSKPVAELLKWVKEQQLPLEVSLKTSSGWKRLSDITTIGPLATRNIIVPVDLAGNGDLIEIKLSSGFMFWEIDYAAMDFTPDHSFTVRKLSPQTATDELGKNIIPLLEKEDGHYLEQPLIGNVATMIYKTIINTDISKTQTYILHVKGYYEHIRDFKNKPDIKFLKKFTQPNAFPVYGMQLYNKIRNENLNELAKRN
ncbi:MAG: hypothetical protein ABI760_06865 [Ferruginibacter sp.]